MSWPLVKLGELCDVVTKGTTPTSLGMDFSTDGIPFLRIQNISDNSVSLNDILYIDEPTHEALKRSKIYAGDFLITIAGTIGRVAIVPEGFPESNCNQAVAVLRFDKSKLSERYLLHWLATDSAIKQIAGRKVSATISNLSLGQIKELEIPLPPLIEQKRIAAILDKADAIRRKRQQAIQLADDFLRAVFLDMFGDPVTNPKGWEVRPVGEICDCIVPGRDKPKSFTGSTPWITTNELNHLGITTKKEEFIGLSEEEVAEVKAKVIPEGSVLMTCVGDLGVVSIAGEDMVINQQLHAFLPCDFVTPSFLSYALAWQKGYMVSMASSTTVPYMNKTVCNSVPVILPSRSLQTRFEKIVEKVTESKTAMAGGGSANLFESISQRSFSVDL